ncbi:lipase [Nocardia seriolae]|uniref:Lipase n=1 Tax=Nocardia seriolae TaxID=37332 RepID=A0ABC9YR40_9NOCA|nr:hypothetical protein NSERKGN1266_67260 [Nocardia seriolae]BEK93503.1 hypothetical protein NSER024013_14090 [Nocardia seriolae]GAM45828.1 lipase [Nocardia seriolae]GAP27853.1 lipase [Nocardia seriolae]GEM23538.1 hypothetical protein NS2_17770 [Nocardia seriolae NBRC 15557]
MHPVLARGVDQERRQRDIAARGQVVAMPGRGLPLVHDRLIELVVEFLQGGDDVQGQLVGRVGQPHPVHEPAHLVDELAVVGPALAVVAAQFPNRPEPALVMLLGGQSVDRLDLLLAHIEHVIGCLALAHFRVMPASFLDQAQ